MSCKGAAKALPLDPPLMGEGWVGVMPLPTAAPDTRI